MGRKSAMRMRTVMSISVAKVLAVPVQNKNKAVSWSLLTGHLSK